MSSILSHNFCFILNTNEQTFVAQIMLGAYYTFGNMSPYLVSYLRNSTGESYTYRKLNIS